MRRRIAEDRALSKARASAFRKAVAYLKGAILALVLKFPSEFADCPEEETRVRSSDGLKLTPVIHWTADDMRVNAYAVAQRACEHAALLMAKYFIFERLESGRLLWMGEAADLEEVGAKLRNLKETNPGSNYFAFDVETGTKIKVESHDDST